MPALALANGAGPLPPAHTRLVARVDSLWAAAARDSAAGLTERGLEPARASRDTTLLMELLIRRGGQLISFGGGTRAEPLLREAAAMAQARGDSLRLCWALRWLAPSVGERGAVDEAARLYARQLALARAQGHERFEAWARCGLGWCAQQRGQPEEAAGYYREAAEGLARAGDRHGRLFALNALGTAFQSAARYPEAVHAYSEVVAEARDLAYAMVEAQALNNLGTLEFMLGDPGDARRRFLRAHAIQDSIGQAREALVPLLNAAACETGLGRLADAAASFVLIAARADSGGYRDIVVNACSQLAEVRLQQGLPMESLRLQRAALSDTAAVPLGERIEMLGRLGEALAQQDSLAAALVVLEQGSRLAGEKLRERPVLILRCLLGRLLLSAPGRADEALAVLRSVDAEADRAGFVDVRVEALAVIADAWRGLSRPDSALASLQRAASAWERAREVPLDPEWREQRGAAGRLVHTELAAMLAEGRRTCRGALAEEVFARLQAFKARTLRERMRGPGRIDPTEAAPLDARRFRQETLREGELFLDAYLGPRASWLVAVTRDSVRAVSLPPAGELAAELRFLRALHMAAAEGAARPADTEALAASARVLAERLLTGCADLVAASRRVIFAPDEALNLLPLAVLPCEEEGRTAPLITRRECIVVPSAGVLADLRAAPATRPAGDARLLAVAGGIDAAGTPLRGADREARRLYGRYAGVTLRAGGQAQAAAPSLDELRAHDALHFALHARADDQAPWRSSLGFAPGPDGIAWSAADIAGARLPARLAVLSGCGTATGRVVSGEGVQGLTAAFLAAGVPAVVATLWPVDDHATADLMGRFYEELAAGRPVAAALRSAQLATRARADVSHPFYWAGFVLVGDGDVTLPLRARQGLPGTVVLAAGAALACIAAFGARRLARSRRV